MERREYYANPYPNRSDSSQNKNQINIQIISLVICMTEALRYFLEAKAVGFSYSFAVARVSSSDIMPSCQKYRQ